MKPLIDLSVAGPYSPVSLKKFNSLEVNEGEGVFKILIPGEEGIAMDDPSFLYITSEERTEQAYYFKKAFFPNNIPDFLLQYMNYFYNGSNTLPTEKQLPMILSLIEYCTSNKEAAQIIGLIVLFHDSLLLANYHKKNVKLFIEEPELYLHPNRERIIIAVLTAIAEKFNIKLHK